MTCSLAPQLGELSRQAAKVPHLTAELEQTQEDLKVGGALGCGQPEARASVRAGM